MDGVDERLSMVDPGERVLLLPHCLRPSQTCPGRQSRSGLVCPEDCTEDCAVRRLREAAVARGYKGVCVAAGGAMAIRFVAERRPRGIVAVACDKELVAGVQAVQEMGGNDDLPILVIPLAKDGCIDTEVDEANALQAIGLGCAGGNRGALT